jgi:hypothetical protein
MRGDVLCPPVGLLEVPGNEGIFPPRTLRTRDPALALHRRKDLAHPGGEGHHRVERGDIAAALRGTVGGVMRKHLLADLPLRDVMRLQRRQRHPDERDLTAQDLHGGAVLGRPGAGRLPHEVVRLSAALRLAEDLRNAASGILDVQVMFFN